jgi:hypothetical protein
LFSSADFDLSHLRVNQDSGEYLSAYN